MIPGVLVVRQAQKEVWPTSWCEAEAGRGMPLGHSRRGCQVLPCQWLGQEGFSWRPFREPCTQRSSPACAQKLPIPISQRQSWKKESWSLFRKFPFPASFAGLCLVPQFPMVVRNCGFSSDMEEVRRRNLCV